MLSRDVVGTVLRASGILLLGMLVLGCRTKGRTQQPTGGTQHPSQAEGTGSVETASTDVETGRHVRTVADALRSGRPIRELSDQIGVKETRAGLRGALRNQDGSVRRACLKHLLSDESLGDQTIVPAAQDLLRSMDILGGHLEDSDRGNETVAVVRLLGKLPHESSVELLIQLAEARPKMYAGKVVSSDGRTLSMENIRGYLPIVAAALRNCSGGVVGHMTGGSWINRANSERLIADWKSRWRRSR